MSHTEAAPTTQGVLATWPEIRAFIFAGNATFTLESKSGARFTYKVTAMKEGTGFFVALLSGNDNERDYAYMGMVRADGPFHFTRGSKVGRDAPSARGIVWFFDKMIVEDEGFTRQCTFWHEGRCGRCGRKLTVPSSVASGIGPECAKA